jgi:bile acid:Na+ symporter, BASS family
MPTWTDTDMKTFGRFLVDRNVIFAAALVLALLVPGAAPYLRPFLLPVLGLVIMISLLPIGPEAFKSPKTVLVNAAAGIGVNYLILTGVILAGARLLISDPELRTGFILAAATPPAVAVVPFAEMLGGSRTLSLFGMVGGFVAAFLLLPLVTLVFIGSDVVEPGRLVVILLVLIVVPFLVSRLFRAVRLDTAAEPYKGSVTNVCFGIAFFIMVAANHDTIIHQTSVLVLPIVVGILIMAVSGGVVTAVSMLLSVDRRTRVSLVLLATLKNYAISAGLGLLLFSERTALPSVIMTIIMIPYIILFDLIYGPPRKKDKPY